MTVLFVDRVDSTAQAETLDPEDVRELHSLYFARVRSEIEHYGGVVEKFIGDAVVGLFGAPFTHEDDPERAVRAALGIRDVIVELNADTPDIELHVRIAVNTGEAVVALGADAAAGEGVVTGDMVNTVWAPPVRSAGRRDPRRRDNVPSELGRDRLPEAESVRAKGKSAPVSVWEAVGLQPDEEEPDPSIPFVGRRRELAQLLDGLVHVCRERTPQLVSLVGEPGIGKTRLARELVAAVDAEPEFGEWLSGRCLPYGDGVSFAALAEMARSEAGISSNDSDERGHGEAARRRRGSPGGGRRRMARVPPPPAGRARGRARGAARGVVRRVASLLRGPGRAAAAGARLRGPALGRSGRSRLRRLPRRLGERRCAPRPLYRAARATRAPARLGRREAQRDHDLAHTTL